jgi:large conductance mechanosensitive channel
MAGKADKAKEKLGELREKNSGFRKEFVEFINRGSVVDLAVGVAVGGAFTAIVNSLVNDMIMPIVGLIGGGVNFRDLKWVIPNFFGGNTEAVIAYGNFIQNVVEFLIIAWVIFMIVKAMNRINRKKDAKVANDKKATKKK